MGKLNFKNEIKLCIDPNDLNSPLVIKAESDGQVGRGIVMPIKI